MATKKKQREFLVGADVANGEIKLSAVQINDDGTLGKRKDVRFAAVRGSVAPGSLALADVKERQFEYYSWYDFDYTVGDTALEHVMGGVQSVQGQRRYGSENQLFMLAVGLHMMGLREGDKVHVCLLAPPSDVARASELYHEGFAKFDGILYLRKSTDRGGQPSAFHIESVRVFPETAAAAIAAVTSDDGQRQRSNPMVNSVMIVDGGRVTLDRLIMAGGAIDKNSVPSATNNRLGIQDMVLAPVAHWGRAGGVGRVYHNGLEELIDRAIRQPKRDANGEVQYYLYRNNEPPANVTRPVVQGIANYTNAVKQYLDTQLRVWNTDRVLLVGGIEPLIGDELRRLYAGEVTFVDLSAYEHLKKVHANQLNAVGALRVLTAAYAKQSA